MANSVRHFFLPTLNRWFGLRVLLVTGAAIFIFTQMLVPLRIEGRSMEPTYHDGSLNFCWRWRYLFSEPEHGDVVMIRFAGRRVMLLKRIVALAGETVAFREGLLFVNGRKVDEPYVKTSSDWQLDTRTVEPGKVYVVGDNRHVAMNRHQFGQVERQRIVGGILW